MTRLKLTCIGASRRHLIHFIHSVDTLKICIKMLAALNIFLTKMALRLFEISIVLSLCVFIRHLSAQVVHAFGIHLVLEHSLKASDTLYTQCSHIHGGKTWSYEE